MAFSAFAAAGLLTWATVHYGADASGRYESVVGAAGRDTFLRAVEAAVGAEESTPWDDELQEDSHIVDISSFGDGIQIAASHAGISTC